MYDNVTYSQQMTLRNRDFVNLASMTLLQGQMVYAPLITVQTLHHFIVFISAGSFAVCNIFTRKQVIVHLIACQV